MPMRNWGDGQEVVMEDFNAAQKALLRELYDRLAYELLNRTENAFFGDSLKVSYSNANTVIVKKGLGFQTDNTQVTPEPVRRPIVLGSDTSLNVTTPDSTHPRIDLVCVKSALIDEITAERNYKDPTADTVSAEDFVVQKDWSSTLSVVAGTPGAVPAAPAVPAGYIKIAEVLVAAVSGISGSGSVTDSRTLMPVGADLKIDTTGAVRITAGASVSLQTAILQIDAFLKNGYQEYCDFDELGADPASPGASKARLYFKGGVWYGRTASGISPLGSGSGGGGGGANWQPVAGAGPVPDYEYNEKVWKFSPGMTQALELWVKVPSGYIAGRPITLKVHAYSPNAADQWKLQAVSTLVRKNTDAIDSTANQNTADGGDVTNTVANMLVEEEILLSSALGTINSVAINPGDLLKVELSRVAPAGTEDAEDLRLIPSATEVLF